MVTVGEDDHYPPNTISPPNKNAFRYKKQQTEKYIYIATYNTLSLRTEESLQELLHSLRDIKWDIIGLSEVRRYGEAIEEHDNFILYHKGETPGRHGVGFLIKKTLKNSISEIIGISERIAILSIEIPPGKEVWSIVQVYSPTEQSTKSEIESFYISLNDAIKDHAHKNYIVMGDFNAQIGPPRNGEDIVLGPYSSGKRTRNGQKLMEMAFENHMKILNSQFKKRLSRKWTWVSPDGRYKNEIDYVLTNRPKSFDDCATIANLNFNSNHRMLRARLNTSSVQKSSRPFKAKTTILGNNAAIVTIQENLRSMSQSCLEHLNTQEKYNIINEMLTAKPNTNQSESKNKSQISEKTHDLLQKRSKLISTTSKTKTIREQIGKLSKEIKLQMRKDREHSRLNTLEKHIKRTGGIKKALKVLTGKTNWIPNMKDQHCKTKTKRTEILSIATNFYKNLYSSKSQIINTDLNNYDNVPPILVEEIHKAIITQKNDKAPGPDGITNELLLGLILGRITKTLDENQPREQAGFRAGYSTLDHIHAVRQIFEKNKEFKVPFYCCFIDYNKAFDSIEHEYIWTCLKNQGVEQK
ncbi:uncharacterized protein LOC111352346 [Spodoptera litura]|uniref:Uncharacterized protein LOC111352346 n=1 Tax=Spodoptera litura TaxID=69820 RepID=A0A9J7E1D3_SPOLT|nr:uncharacterized protein LOC111352346 [Spodoptera litura]